jgi:hypothetical protein
MPDYDRLLDRLLFCMGGWGGFTAGVYGDHDGVAAMLLMLLMSMSVQYCLRTIIGEWRRSV